jgi:hypothetical protein
VAGGAPACVVALEKVLSTCGFAVVDMVPARRQNLDRRCWRPRASGWQRLRDNGPPHRGHDATQVPMGGAPAAEASWPAAPATPSVGSHCPGFCRGWGRLCAGSVSGSGASYGGPAPQEARTQ